MFINKATMSKSGDKKCNIVKFDAHFLFSKLSILIDNVWRIGLLWAIIDGLLSNRGFTDVFFDGF